MHSSGDMRSVRWKFLLSLDEKHRGYVAKQGSTAVADFGRP